MRVAGLQLRQFNRRQRLFQAPVAGRQGKGALVPVYFDPGVLVQVGVEAEAQPAAALLRTPLLAQQALNTLPRSKCNPQSGPEFAAGKNQTLNLPVGRLEVQKGGK